MGHPCCFGQRCRARGWVLGTGCPGGCGFFSGGSADPPGHLPVQPAVGGCFAGGMDSAMSGGPSRPLQFCDPLTCTRCLAVPTAHTSVDALQRGQPGRHRPTSGLKSRFGIAVHEESSPMHRGCGRGALNCLFSPAARAASVQLQGSQKGCVVLGADAHGRHGDPQVYVMWMKNKPLLRLCSKSISCASQVLLLHEAAAL